MLQEDIYQQAVDKIKNVLKSQLDEDRAQALQDMVTRIVAEVWLQDEHARLVITRINGQNVLLIAVNIVTFNLLIDAFINIYEEVKVVSGG